MFRDRTIAQQLSPGAEKLVQVPNTEQVSEMTLKIPGNLEVGDNTSIDRYMIGRKFYRHNVRVHIDVLEGTLKFSFFLNCSLNVLLIIFFYFR